MSREFKYKDVLQTWMDGKDIQYTTGSTDWIDYKNVGVPNVINPLYDWRIKPQTKTVWINIYRTCGGEYWCSSPPHEDEESAKSRSGNPNYVTTISIEEEIV